jgi:hypothetical protein
LVNTDPDACITARETKFSEAISWMWVRCRSTSLRISDSI